MHRHRQKLFAGILAFLTVFLAAAQGTVVFFDDALPTTMNPLFPRTEVDVRAHELVFDRLFFYSSVNDDYRSRLVSHWEVTDEGKVRLEIVNRARWHDREPVTAEDVCFSVSALIDPDTPSTLPARAHLRGCEVDEEGGVMLEMSSIHEDPRPLLSFPILPAHAFEGPAISPDDPFGQAPIGSGPMSATIGRRGVKFTAHQSPHVQPQIQSMRLEEGGDPMVQVRVAQNGGVHGLIRVSPPLISELAADSNMALKSYQVGSWWYIAVNTATVPDSRVRKALDRALDRRVLRNETVGQSGDGAEEQCQLISGPFVPNSPFSNSGVPVVAKSRPDEVHQLMEETGAVLHPTKKIWYQKGEPIVLRLLMVATLDLDARGLLIKVGQQLEEAGFQTELVKVSSRDFHDRLLSGEPFQGDLLVGRWSGTQALDLEALFHTPKEGKGRLNIYNYSNPEVDALLAAQSAATTEFDAQNAYWELHALLNEDRPYLFLWAFDSSWSAWDKSIENVVITPYYYFSDLEYWRLAK